VVVATLIGAEMVLIEVVVGTRAIESGLALGTESALLVAGVAVTLEFSPLVSDIAMGYWVGRAVAFVGVLSILGVALVVS